MSDRLKVGIIGLGEVTQATHLPALRRLSDRFEVAALCDASPATLAAVAAKWHVAATEQDPQALVARTDIDAVLIAVPDMFHCDFLLAAMAAGKHVLVEKPLCVTLSQADKIVAAAEASDRVVQVGYMRNFAPALQKVKAELSAAGPVRHVKVTDVIGANRMIVDQVAKVERNADLTDVQINAANDLKQSLFVRRRMIWNRRPNFGSEVLGSSGSGYAA